MSDDVDNCLKLKGARERIMEEAVKKATGKVDEINGFIPLACSLLMVNGEGSLLHDILMAV